MNYLQELLGDAYKEGMTEEELSTALQSIEAAKKAAKKEPEGSSATDITKLKAALSKANSEAADYKKQLRAKQSDDEAKEATRQEEWEKMVQENTELKHSIEVADKKNKLLSMGYDDELAGSTATAMVEGDLDTVMANQAKYLEVQKKTISADLMKKTPRPVAGVETGGIDYNAKIDEARTNGDYSAVAYYTRLQAQDAEETIND